MLTEAWERRVLRRLVEMEDGEYDMSFLVLGRI